jgi:integration host factor subunit beta
MLKSELVSRLAARYELPIKGDADRVVSTVLEAMSKALAKGQRIELRGFGSFSVKQRPSRIGRNPRSGAPVSVCEKLHPRFRGSKDMRDRLNDPSQSNQGL